MGITPEMAELMHQNASLRLENSALRLQLEDPESDFLRKWMKAEEELRALSNDAFSRAERSEALCAAVAGFKARALEVCRKDIDYDMFGTPNQAWFIMKEIELLPLIEKEEHE